MVQRALAWLARRNCHPVAIIAQEAGKNPWACQETVKKTVEFVLSGLASNSHLVEHWELAPMKCANTAAALLSVVVAPLIAKSPRIQKE